MRARKTSERGVAQATVSVLVLSALVAACSGKAAIPFSCQFTSGGDTEMIEMSGARASASAEVGDYTVAVRVRAPGWLAVRVTVTSSGDMLMIDETRGLGMVVANRGDDLSYSCAPTAP